MSVFKSIRSISIQCGLCSCVLAVLCTIVSLVPSTFAASVFNMHCNVFSPLALIK